MKGSTAGFSLIEVLVAISIMALVMSGFASMDLYTIQSDTHGRQQSAAAVSAQNKLDDLRVLRRTHADWAPGEHRESVEEDSAEYLREWTVETNYNNYSKLSRVTVTVSRGNKSVSFSSLY